MSIIKFEDVVETEQAELYGDDCGDQQFNTETWTAWGYVKSTMQHVQIKYVFDKSEVEDLDADCYPWDAEHATITLCDNQSCSECDDGIISSETN